jgi:hypothetical protein
MSTTTPHQHDHDVPAADPALACPEEVEAWLDEVQPVVAALRHRTAPPSNGQHRWMADLIAACDVALDHLQCEADDVAGVDGPCHDLHWLHTRVSALLEAARALGPEQATGPGPDHRSAA